VTGGRPGEALGTSVAAATDLDRDGFADVIVGSRDAELVRVYSGLFLAHGEGPPLLVELEARADRVNEDFFGQSVASIGDLDGDGFSEIAIGAPLADEGGPGSGAVYVHSGRTFARLATVLGHGREFGATVCGPGDLDGDGIPDLAVAAPVDVDHPRYRAGQVRVYSGRDLLGSPPEPLFSFQGVGAYDLLGFSLCGAGDVDGDGHADLLAGAPEYDPISPATLTVGYARVISGRTGGILATLSTGLVGRFGYSTAGMGDWNGDGFDDVAVGAPHATGSAGADCGRIFIYSGASLRPGQPPTILRMFEGEHPGEVLGRTIARGGDLDGDGRADLLATGLDGSGASFVRVISGRNGEILAHTLSRGTDSGFAAFAHSIAFAGDVDGDAIDDLVVGSPGDSSTGFLVGSLTVFSGSPTLSLLMPENVIAGTSLDLDYEGADPQGEVLLLFGAAPLDQDLPFCNQTLGLRNPRLVARSYPRASGQGSIPMMIPQQRRGQTVFLQMFQRRGCRVSNRVALDIR
jgi:hypothetical protein